MRGPHRDRGYVLLFATMLIVALFGIAGVVVDVALAHLTQHAMQTAAEVAALEGLRWRDVDGDAGRRQRAQAVVAEQFDDDFDPTTAETTYHFGAGPSFALTDAAPPSAGLITLDDPPVWKPALAANGANAQWGDLVAGDFHAGAGTEASDYSRGDFAAAPDASLAQTAPSFLVRLRRVAHPTDGDLDDDAASVGPPLPLLFAWGSFAHGLEDGITVRGTAIAHATVALAVNGTASLDEGGRPLAPFAVRAEEWNQGSDPIPAIAVFVFGTDPLSETLRVGQALPVTGLSGAPLDGPDFVVPIFKDVGAERRIVGFGSANVASGQVLPIHESLVAVGATALSRDALVAPEASEAHALTNPLLAPVLVR